jgi:hypothetical protein
MHSVTNAHSRTHTHDDHESIHDSGTSVMRPTNRGGPGQPAAGNDIDSLIAAAKQKQAAASGEAAPEANIGHICLYKNGFIIGDGEFRDVSDAKNKAFLQALQGGDVPPELERELRQQWGPAVDRVGVSLKDKSQETYTPPPPKFNFATSQGQSLGGSAAAAAASAVTSFAAATAREAVVDAASPTTVVQVVLANRQRVKVTLNAAATTLQLHEHVMFVTGAAAAAFTLTEGFPPKPLADAAATLEAAGLLRGSVTQKMF